MTACRTCRDQMVEVLLGEERAQLMAQLQSHLSVCSTCREEWEGLKGAWGALDRLQEAEPPAWVRASVLERAREAASSQSLASLWARLRAVINGRIVPVAVGGTTTFAVVGLLHLRQAMNPTGHLPMTGIVLLLAVALSVIFSVLRSRDADREVRALLAAGVGGLTLFTLLSLASPVPETFRFCHLQILGGAPLSMGQICLTYFILGILYAGLAMGLMGYLFAPRTGRSWRIGLAEASVFSFLALPLVLLQSASLGLGISLGWMAGMASGALAGGMLGLWMRSLRWAVP